MNPLRILKHRLSTTALPPALTLHARSPLIRPLHPSSSTATPAPTLAKPDDFVLYPNFLNEEEQEVLVTMGLWKLGRSRGGDRRRARRQRGVSAGAGASDTGASGLQRLFTGEYAFEEGHYDSVIHDYRESLLSTLPSSPHPLLVPTLNRIYALFFSSLPPSPAIETNTSTPTLPPAGTLTHILHLSPLGSILPHVDNLEASGRVILGVSLGAERTLRLRRKFSDGEGEGERTREEGWEVRLGSGSVYIQRDLIRYGYEHSILPFDDPSSIWDGKKLEMGHRISIMIRDAPPKPDLLRG
ncbi:hypothetical protein I312_102276 [Cryptococcus bacillisporus CA1280]|uniref:Alpha-ketoglutarate-dependent dioxygenase AlkB-like domain-containing protein n=1 Tax=Cryptococcus bacillisporus CA1280 TaxID=1296109 RepID=A0A0D0VTI3_CRYGA|nr:hypothetical protein I312_01770 [Cryptococcus bacillisporus CA1280]